MLKHEQTAFWKFFSIYFGSVALLILAAGYFYFMQQQKALIQKEHFSMIEHIRKLKMNEHEEHVDGIIHIITDKKIENFNINNFTINDEYFELYLPYNWEKGYYLVKKDKIAFNANVLKIKTTIIFVQMALLLLFALISYFLSLRALKPMREAMTKLDNFSKDLIHDLNTPITSMFLNIKILEKKSDFRENKALSRIKQSLEDIGELHANLNMLLQEGTLQMRKEDIYNTIAEVVDAQKKIWTEVEFNVDQKEFFTTINADAFKQIMTNIISNACKYNTQNPSISIYMKENILYIQDSGIGIKNPHKIFERSYKEQSSGHGIGLDIVQRLCDTMMIDIKADSQVGEGTTISLKFNS